MAQPSLVIAIFALYNFIRKIYQHQGGAYGKEEMV